MPGVMVKFRSGGAETHTVNLQRCPYDGTPIEAEAYSGGSFLLTCTACGAEWEAHNSLVRRLGEPDWDRARAARCTPDPTVEPAPPASA